MQVAFDTSTSTTQLACAFRLDSRAALTCVVYHEAPVGNRGFKINVELCSKDAAPTSAGGWTCCVHVDGRCNIDLIKKLSACFACCSSHIRGIEQAGATLTLCACAARGVGLLAGGGAGPAGGVEPARRDLSGRARHACACCGVDALAWAAAGGYGDEVPGEIEGPQGTSHQGLVHSGVCEMRFRPSVAETQAGQSCVTRSHSRAMHALRAALGCWPKEQGLQVALRPPAETWPAAHAAQAPVEASTPCPGLQLGTKFGQVAHKRGSSVSWAGVRQCVWDAVWCHCRPLIARSRHSLAMHTLRAALGCWPEGQGLQVVLRPPADTWPAGHPVQPPVLAFTPWPGLH